MRTEKRVKRAMAEDHCVMAHVRGHFHPGSSGAATVDIFRIENGKLVQHWDVTQRDIAEVANTDCMFQNGSRQRLIAHARWSSNAPHAPAGRLAGPLSCCMSPI